MRAGARGSRGRLASASLSWDARWAWPLLWTGMRVAADEATRFRDRREPVPADLTRGCAALPNNPVMAARFAHLTTREDNRLARQQARTACAAALLRWIHVVVTRRVTWDPAIAAGSTPLRQAA
jgi:hypothetical protein